MFDTVLLHNPQKTMIKEALNEPITVFLLFLIFVLSAYLILSEPPKPIRTYPRQNFNSPSFCNETFDIVYTWVNGSDPLFQERLRQYSPNSTKRDRRYHDREELRYSLRSLEKFGGSWIGQVYLVTNGQVPYWLNLDRVKLITHDQFYIHLTHLPTFSSPSIESNLFKIPGLSKRFLYFNDDVLFGAPVFPEDFISPRGIHKIYLSWELPDCAPQCAENFIGDKYCDAACNVSECEFDRGDCASPPPTSKSFRTRQLEEENGDDYMFSTKSEDSTKKKKLDLDSCSLGCSIAWVGDGICDSACRNEYCGFDAADCPKDSKSLLASFPYSDSSTIQIQRPNKRNRFWYSFLIDLKDAPTVPFFRNKIKNIHHSQPSFIQALTYVKKWSALLVIASLRALDLETNNSTDLKRIVNCTVEYEVFMNISSSNATSNGSLDKNIKKLAVPKKSILKSTNFSFVIVNGGGQWNLTKGQDDEDEEKLNDVESRSAYGELTMRDEEDTYANAALSAYAEKTSKSSSSKDKSYFDEIDGEIDDDVEKVVNLDTFGKSLLYSKNQLNTLFNRKVELNKKVPAHMPHLIDVEIYTKLYQALKPAFESTSSHRFRSDEDLQFGYVYFTFLMAQIELELDDQVVWSAIDSNGDGCLNANEFRSLMTMIFSEDSYYVTKPPSSKKKSSSAYMDDYDLETLPRIDSQLLILAHDKIWEEARGSSLVPMLDTCLNLGVLKKANRAYSALMKHMIRLVKRTRPNYEIVDSEPHVTFAMLRDKPSEVLKTLDQLRARPTKFVCINDDTTPNQDNKSAIAVDKALKQFYEAWFPIKSSYEMDSIKSYKKQQQEHQKKGALKGTIEPVEEEDEDPNFFWIRIFFYCFCLGLVLFCYLFFRKIEQGFFSRCFPFVKRHGL